MAKDMIGGLIGAIVLIILVGATLNIVTDSFLGFNSSASNVTGATARIAPVIPVIYLIGVLLGVLAVVGVWKLKA